MAPFYVVIADFGDGPEVWTDAVGPVDYVRQCWLENLDNFGPDYTPTLIEYRKVQL